MTRLERLLERLEYRASDSAFTVGYNEAMDFARVETQTLINEERADRAEPPVSLGFTQTPEGHYFPRVEESGSNLRDWLKAIITDAIIKELNKK